MRAATIRRILVYGVCLAGVAALYLYPGLARVPRPGGVAVPEAEASAASAPIPSASVTGARPTPAPSSESPSSESPSSGSLGPSPVTPGAPRSLSTPFDAGRDHTPPAPVSLLEVLAATRDQLTIAWSAGQDDVGVVGYQVWLDGFRVAAPTGTQASVRWFNDDPGDHVITVYAVDAAGNVSTAPATLLVTRPGA